MKTNETAKRQAAWSKVWARWIAAKTPEEKRAALRYAKAWATRSGEELPRCMHL